MSSARVSFAVLAALVTITPGIDTVMVLRATWPVPPVGAATAAGIFVGVLAWGVAAAVGVSALLATWVLGTCCGMPVRHTCWSWGSGCCGRPGEVTTPTRGRPAPHWR